MVHPSTAFFDVSGGSSAFQLECLKWPVTDPRSNREHFCQCVILLCQGVIISLRGESSEVSSGMNKEGHVAEWTKRFTFIMLNNP